MTRSDRRASALALVDVADAAYVALVEPADLVIVGRSTSHYTRVARLLAHELGVPLRLSPLFDMTRLDAEDYGGHPALKLPTLHIVSGSAGTRRVFGTVNICRELAARAPHLQVAFDEDLDAAGRNLAELAWHGMQAQVQLIFGTQIAKLPPDNIYFAKTRAGFAGALAWVDAHLDDVIAAAPRVDVVLVEVVVFSLVDHIIFRERATGGAEERGTVSLDPYARLRRFHDTFGARASALATPYVFDPRPT